MTLQEVATLLRSMGIPLVYHHFAEGESPDPPFLLYLSPGSDNFAADGIAYFKVTQVDIELYTDEKARTQRHSWKPCSMERGFSTIRPSPTSSRRSCTKFYMNWRSDPYG